jgi:hypothetical protein
LVADLCYAVCYEPVDFQKIIAEKGPCILTQSEAWQ